jgi:uncharacterized protein (TIRG00374 family)
MKSFKEFAKKNWFGLVSLAFSIVILVIFTINSGGLRGFFSDITGLNFYWLTATFLCTALFWLTDGFILHRLVKLKYRRHRFADTFKSTVIGFLYNCLTPFASGGQPMQIYDMTKSGVDAGDAASYVTVKSVVYQICLTIYAAVAAIFTFGFFRERVPHFIFFLCVGMFVNAVFVIGLLAVIYNKNAAVKLGLLFIALLVKLRIIKNREKATQATLTQIALFNESFRLILRGAKELALSFALTVLQLTLYYCLPYLIYRCFNLSGESFHLILFAQSILMLITAFVPMPGSSGAVETGFYFFFGVFFTPGTIMPAVIIWRFLTYYLCIIAGGFASLFGIKRKEK